jgi:hypothetical protein
MYKKKGNISLDFSEYKILFKTIDLDIMADTLDELGIKHKLIIDDLKKN